ncbi:hypothetical protein pb186bvf_017491 [Paramecium bursaria]
MSKQYISQNQYQVKKGQKFFMIFNSILLLDFTFTSQYNFK